MHLLILAIAIMIGFPAARRFAGSILLGVVLWLFVVGAALATIGTMFG